MEKKIKVKYTPESSFGITTRYRFAIKPENKYLVKLDTLEIDNSISERIKRFIDSLLWKLFLRLANYFYLDKTVEEK